MEAERYDHLVLSLVCITIHFVVTFIIELHVIIYIMTHIEDEIASHETNLSCTFHEVLLIPFLKRINKNIFLMTPYSEEVIKDHRDL